MAMSEKLGEAIIELRVKDAKFQQGIKQQNARVAAAAGRLAQQMQIVQARKQMADVRAAARDVATQSRASAMRQQLAIRELAIGQQTAGIAAKARATAAAASLRMESKAVDRRRQLAYQEARDSQRAGMMRLAHEQRMDLVRTRNAAARSRTRSVAPRSGGGGIGSAFGGALAGGAIGGMAGAFAGNMLADAVSGMADLAGAGFRFNSQMEDAQLSFAAMLGDEKKAIALLAKLKEFSDITPFEFPDMTRAAGMMLSTGKFTDKQIPDIVEKLSDTAAGSTKGLGALPNISLAMSQIYSKIESGKISAQDMNQLIEAGVHPWQALAKAVGVSEAQVREMAQNGGLDISHVNGMLDELGKKFKGLSKTKGEKTLSGLLSTLKDKINSTLGAISLPLFEDMKKQVKGLIGYLNSEAFTDWTKKLTAGVSTAIQFVKDLVNNPVAQAIAKFALLAGGVAAVMGAMAGMAAAAKLAFLSAPAIAMIGVVTTLAASIKKAFDGPEGAKFRDVLAGIVRNVGEIVNNITGKLIPAVAEFADSWLSAMGGSETMASGIEGILGMLGEFTDWLSIVSSDWQLMWDEVELMAEEMWEGLVDGWLEAIAKITPAITKAIEDGVSAAAGALAKAADMMTPGYAVREGAKSAAAQKPGEEGGGWATAGNYINAAIDGLSAGMSQSGSLSEAIERSTSAWGDMYDAFGKSLYDVQSQAANVATDEKRMKNKPIVDDITKASRKVADVKARRAASGLDDDAFSAMGRKRRKDGKAASEAKAEEQKAMEILDKAFKDAEKNPYSLEKFDAVNKAIVDLEKATKARVEAEKRAADSAAAFAPFDLENAEAGLAARKKELADAERAANETPRQKALRERREAIDARKEAAKKERDDERKAKARKASRDGMSAFGNSLAEEVKNGASSLMDKTGLPGFADALKNAFTTPSGEKPAVTPDKKPFKNDFLQFGDLNREIQKALGDSSEKDAKKKAADAAKKTEKNTSDTAKAAKELLDPLKDIAGKIGNVLGMGS